MSYISFSPCLILTWYEVLLRMPDKVLSKAMAAKKRSKPSALAAILSVG
jgi:hypothetical protein